MFFDGYHCQLIVVWMHIVGASDSLLFLRKLVASLLLWHAVPTYLLFYSYATSFFFRVPSFRHTTWQEIKTVINQPPEEKRFYDSTIRIIQTPFRHMDNTLETRESWWSPLHIEPSTTEALSTKLHTNQKSPRANRFTTSEEKILFPI